MAVNLFVAQRSLKIYRSNTDVNAFQIRVGRWPADRKEVSTPPGSDLRHVVADSELKFGGKDVFQTDKMSIHY